jgi:hypothetical protein
MTIPTGEPPQLPDRRARPVALRGCREDGGVSGPGPQADLQGGHHPALRAGSGPHLQKLTEMADRGFCIYNEQAPVKDRKAEAKMPGEQRTLEAYS